MTWMSRLHTIPEVSAVQAGFLPPLGITTLSTSNPHAADISQPRLPAGCRCFEWGVPSPAPGDTGKRVSPGGGELLAPGNFPGAPLWLAYKGLGAGLQRTPAALPRFLPAVLGKLFPEHSWEMRKYRHSPGLHWNEREPPPRDPALHTRPLEPSFTGWKDQRAPTTPIC